MTGSPLEVLLWVSGRQWVAQVDVTAGARARPDQHAQEHVQHDVGPLDPSRQVVHPGAPGEQFVPQDLGRLITDRTA